MASVSALAVTKETFFGRALIPFGLDTTLYPGGTVGVTLSRLPSPHLCTWSPSAAGLAFDYGPRCDDAFIPINDSCI